MEGTVSILPDDRQHEPHSVATMIRLGVRPQRKYSLYPTRTFRHLRDIHYQQRVWSRPALIKPLDYFMNSPVQVRLSRCDCYIYGSYYTLNL